ncbi:MAG: tetratricopeptide repeat protein, partial [Acidobacteriota bacterium]|nr:tetratricopeptide repeat protein [Acidobacteriota bacterium]
PNTKDIDYLRGYTHRAAGNFDKARELLEKFVAKNPNHIDSLASLAYVAIEQGRLIDAEPLLKKILTLDPDNTPALFDFARLAVKQRNYEEGARRLEKVVAKDTLHTQAFYQLFLTYSRLKLTAKAQTALADFKRLGALEKQSTQDRLLDEKIRTQQMLNQP